MERTKRTVDELNELAKKMTGTNPKARTDAEALNYIEQNYTPGGGGGGGCDCPIYFIDSTIETVGAGSIKITLDLTGTQLRDMMNENNNKLIIKATMVDEQFGDYVFMDMDEIILGATDKIIFKTPYSMSQNFGEAMEFESSQGEKFSWTNVPPS